MKSCWAACLIAAAVTVSAATDPSARTGPPNVVFILADDLGWTDAGFAGSRFYETPQLDALASAGLRFTAFYTSPTGVPTRAALLTGQYGARTGVFGESEAEGTDAPTRRLTPPAVRTALPAGLATIPSLLQAAGYATGFLGTWPLGMAADQHPRARGFAETIVVTGTHFKFETDPPQEIPGGTYLADFLTDQAAAFVERHQNKPFLLFISHFSVQPPMESKPGVIDRFARKPPAGGHRDAAYAAMIASLDDSVGRLVARLDALQLGRETVVIFTSDNGGAGGYVEAEAGGRRSGVTDNAPLRGGKGMLYEGGLRVPFLVRWMGTIPPGSRTTQPCIDVDLLPTVCDVAGVRLPEGQAVDGQSLVPLFKNPAAFLGRDAIFWHFPGYRDGTGRGGMRVTPMGAIRAGNFKLLEFFEDGRLELYNLAEDLGEKDNLVRSLPAKAEELAAKLAAWRRALGAPMPAPKAGGNGAPPPPPAPPKPAP